MHMKALTLRATRRPMQDAATALRQGANQLITSFITSPLFGDRAAGVVFAILFLPMLMHAGVETAAGDRALVVDMLILLPWAISIAIREWREDNEVKKGGEA